GRTGQIMLVNAQTERLFGYRRDELLGQPIERLIPERFHPQHVRHRAGYITAPRTRPMGSDLELYARRKDGTEFPVEISLSSVEMRDGSLVSSAIRDVSERKRAEALSEQAELLEQTHDAVIVRGLDGVILYWNPGAEDLYGWSRIDAAGQVLHSLLQTRFPESAAAV